MLASDLDMVRGWRNQIAVRRYMYTQHEISELEHYRWFQRTAGTPGIHLLIFEMNDVGSGFVNLTQVRQGPVADWSFHLAASAEKGAGRWLGCAALDYAFYCKKLHKICGEALEFNKRSVRHHLRLGFTREGRLRDQHFDGENFYSVERFGILAAEWFAVREEMGVGSINMDFTAVHESDNA